MKIVLSKFYTAFFQCMVLAMKIAKEAGMVLEIQTKIVQLETQECVLYERPVKTIF